MEVLLEDERITLQGPLLEQPITPFGAIFGSGEQKRSDLSLARHYAFEGFSGGLGIERVVEQHLSDDADQWRLDMFVAVVGLGQSKAHVDGVGDRAHRTLHLLSVVLVQELPRRLVRLVQEEDELAHGNRSVEDALVVRT